MNQRQKSAHGEVAQYDIRVAQNVRIGNRALSVSAFHIRMRLVDDEGVRSGFPRGPQYIRIGHAEAAAAHGGVILHLPRHEHEGFPFREFWRQSGPESRIVFGQPLVQNQGAQGGGTIQQRGMVGMFRHGVANIFQFAGPGGIVINALSVHHQRIGPVEIRSQAHGTDEAVLHTRQRHARIVTLPLQRFIHVG